MKKAEEDKIGGDAIRNASLVKSRRKAAEVEADGGAADDESSDVEVVAEPAPIFADRTVIHYPSTPAPDTLRNWSPPPHPLIANAASDDDDSDIQCIGHRVPEHPNIDEHVKIKAEVEPSTIPDDPSVKAKAPKAKNNSTPLPSIPRTARKASLSKKRAQDDDSDAENTPLPRNSKRVRQNKSFDVQNFLLEERDLRNEFQDKMLRQMRHSNMEFHKSAENTRAFQTEFLGLLRDVFPKN
jgi:hypothetical protein